MVSISNPLVRRNTFRPNWEVMVYGGAHLLDALICMASVGMLLGGMTHRTSLWMARRDMRKRSA